MIPTELLSIGIGGVIAGIVLFWKRQDDLRHDKESEAHARALEVMFARMELRDKSSIEIVQANTIALVALQTAVAQLNTLKQLSDKIIELVELEKKRG